MLISRLLSKEWTILAIGTIDLNSTNWMKPNKQQRKKNPNVDIFQVLLVGRKFFFFRPRFVYQTTNPERGKHLAQQCRDPHLGVNYARSL